MRRSNHIAFLGVSGLVLLGLVTCSEDDEPLVLPDQVSVFSDAQACMDAGNLTAECQDAASEAHSAHINTAPQFLRQADCEAIHGDGNCQTLAVSDGSSVVRDVFIPAMAGFVLGRSLGLSSPLPVSADRQGFIRVAGGADILGQDCARVAPGQPIPPGCPAATSGGGGWSSYSTSHDSSSDARRRTTTVSTQTSSLHGVTRGGFGSSSHGFSSRSG